LRKTPVKRITVKELETLKQMPVSSKLEKKVKKTVTTTMHTIEKNIPIPNHIMQKYPLHDLEIGDSFVVPMAESKNVRSAIGRIHSKNENLRFVTRTVIGRGRAGKQMRIWRTAR
tara:strand:- start:1065 stop:1409 length:345 start_codon:yes stop_codon:yes gene_type:complete